MTVVLCTLGGSAVWGSALARGPGVVTKLDVTQPNLNNRSVYNFEIAILNCVTTIN
jgi:hypothetical protein